MTLKTPEQLLINVDKKNKELLDHILILIGKELEKNFKGSGINVMLPFKKEFIESIFSCLQKELEKSYWEITIIGTGFTIERDEHAPWTSVYVNPNKGAS